MKTNMARRRQLTCAKSSCSEPPYSGGLCKRHHEEDAHRRERRRVAIETLHTTTVVERLPDDLALREELLQLCERWHSICSTIITQQGTKTLPVDEAEYASEWCIALAQEIVDAEFAHRSGGAIKPSLAATREWVSERFANLDAGLMSNGLPRPKA
jgi:hypothetical protein